MSFTVDQVPPTMPAQPTPVPTLGQWALMLLTLALAGLAAIRSRRT
ncbi:IPTL-CTERM sorting domain-containing protein [Diaphorobacter ruginosibacter]|uniref:IPTL-CTERM sorting domain-containing protein n=2 Tax=Diaphorobacter ruginosibacter TaxID=1715720 RepID=A0A7G9RNJ7_9BURK|nr:IPTL-CTERM sorting domain-containing protein [Diaphorobacter ruginosibacter]